MLVSFFFIPLIMVLKKWNKRLLKDQLARAPPLLLSSAWWITTGAWVLLYEYVWYLYKERCLGLSSLYIHVSIDHVSNMNTHLTRPHITRPKIPTEILWVCRASWISTLNQVLTKSFLQIATTKKKIPRRIGNLNTSECSIYCCLGPWGPFHKSVVN